MTMWRNWNFYTLLVKCEMGQPLWKIAWQFLKMLTLGAILSNHS